MTSFADVDYRDAQRLHLCVNCLAPAARAPNGFWLDYCETCLPVSLAAALKAAREKRARFK